MDTSEDFVTLTNCEIEQYALPNTVIQNSETRQIIEDHTFLNYSSEQFYKYQDGEVSFDAMLQPESILSTTMFSLSKNYITDLLNHLTNKNSIDFVNACVLITVYH